MSTIGLVHMILSLLALGVGAVVLIRPKSGRWHRSLGHIYFGMIAMNITLSYLKRSVALPLAA